MDHKLYLSDKGIYRTNGRFYYHKNNQIVTDQRILERVSRLVVPPAWIQVWFASNPKCHIQVHGIDTGGKKQYILSQQWVNHAKYEKFNRMKRFIRDLLTFKRLVSLKRCVITRETLIHLLFNLLIELHVRVGNEIYAENNSTYGLTTLRQKHLEWNGETFQLKFVGKSNISHLVEIPSKFNPWFHKLKSSNLNAMLFICNGRAVTSEELNDYLKANMGRDYTCKDFRTYSANMLFIQSFLKNSKNTDKNAKRCVLMSIDESAEQLGHTRSISRKSYISESLIDFCIYSFGKAKLLSGSSLLSRVWS